MITSLLDHNFVRASLQVALVVLAAAPLPRLLGVWSPAARLLFWRVLMIACLLTPLLQPRVPVDRTSAPGVVSGAEVSVSADAAAPPAAGPPLSAVVNAWPRSITLPRVIAAGVLLRLGWLALGLVILGRLRAQATLLKPRPTSVDEAVAITGADARFLVSPRALRPMTFGVRRPVILLPVDFTALVPERQKAVACHELLHVKRRDWLRTAADELVRTVAWFHPAAWWLTSQVHLAREQIVDQQVVRCLGRRRAYLEALLHMASSERQGALLPVAPFLGRAHLPQRIALLVKEVPMSGPRLVASFAAMAAALTVCGLVVVQALPLHASSSDPEATRPGAVVAQAPARSPAQPAPGEPAGYPRRIRDVRPVFPGEEFAGDAAPWVFEITVDAAGNVSEVEALTGPTDLSAEAAIAAMRQWKYEPPPTAPYKAMVGFNLAAGRGETVGVPPVLVGGQIKAPVKVHHVKPVYTPEALEARVQGVVILEALIDAKGEVAEARVIRSVPLLDRSALEAVLRWRFTPVNVPVQVTFTVNYTLDDTPKPGSAAEVAAGGKGGGGGVAGGIRGGVAGGIRGGVAGGIRDGVVGGPDGGVGGGVGAGVGGGVAGGLGTDEGYVRVGGEIAPPKKIIDVRPVYPEAAKEKGVQGVVVMEATIEPDGRVGHLDVLRSVPDLDQAAIEAVRQWVFTPTLKDGRPVGVVMTVTVNFTLQ